MKRGREGGREMRRGRMGGREERKPPPTPAHPEALSSSILPRVMMMLVKIMSDVMWLTGAAAEMLREWQVRGRHGGQGGCGRRRLERASWRGRREDHRTYLRQEREGEKKSSHVWMSRRRRDVVVTGGCCGRWNPQAKGERGGRET